MGTSQIFTKDSNAILDYQINWATWLGTDTIASASWFTASGITMTASSFTTTTATIWLSGGTVGLTYDCTNRIITAGATPRTDERTITIAVVNK